MCPGRLTYCIHRASSDHFILQIIDVFVLKDEVPAIVLLYQRGTRTTPISAVVFWMQEHIASRKLVKIPASQEEHMLLYNTLQMNAERISEDYKPKRRATEKDFKLSFLLPSGPLSQKDVGSLTNNTGCLVCGEAKAKNCTSCRAVQYCGPGV